jgi:gliding motility-associated-like protein
MNTNKVVLYSIIPLILLSFVSFTLSSQIVINEYSCSNVSVIADNNGEYEDWIELYNSGSGTVDIGGYYLSDRPTNPLKWQIPAGTSLNAGEHMLFFASALNESAGGFHHTNFKLTQTLYEHIILSDVTGVLVDAVQLLPAQEDHSRGRETDGANNWSLFLIPTAGTTNSNPTAEYATTPVFNFEAGLYTAAVTLEINCPDPNVTIRYTDDGSDPINASTEVTGPITVSATTVIRARVFPNSSVIPASFIETNTYFINDSHSIKVVSICGDKVDLLLNGNTTRRDGVFEYFDENQVFMDEATGEFNKHGNDSWAYAQRGFDFISRDQQGYNHAINSKIFATRDRESFQRLIIKAAANDNYPFEEGAHIRDSYVHLLAQLGDLNVDLRTHESCIVYLNGEYWGVYELREKADDHDFTEYYYDQRKHELMYLKTWGGTWSEYGGVQAQTEWDNLKNYIIANDMTVQANFDYVTSLYDWTSLVDYVVLNSYVVCSDWLNWNTAWWYGTNPNGDMQRWRYVLWDLDATFGHYINYTGIPNTNPNADPCNPEGLNDPGNQGHIPILNALFENSTFQQYYVSRFIDLSNTVFSCDNMQNLLDSLIDIIDPEMDDQCTKWGGTYVTWKSKVSELKTFIDQRCIDLSDGMIDCYDLTGPYELMFKVEPAGVGKIKINSITPEQYPYFGTYFGDIDILLTAEAVASGYVFDRWELLHHSTAPNLTDPLASLSLLSSDTIVAVFSNPVPIVDLGIDTAICIGTTLTLDAGNPDATYIWQDGTETQTIEVDSPGLYSVSVTNLGFTSVDNINIDILYPPSVDLGPRQQVCPGQDVYLEPIAQFAYEFDWSTGDSTSMLIVEDAGIYALTVTNICGVSADSVEVSVGYSPYVELGTDQVIEPGQSISLDVSLENATYLWQDNSTNSVFTVTESGQYWVIVTNSCGSAFDDVNVSYEIVMLIPNSFTPNDDGRNDEFTIKAKGIADDGFLLQIYDRLGSLVFESDNIDDRWDGKFRNKLARTTVFHYTMKYKDLYGNSFEENGIVTVIIR